MRYIKFLRLVRLDTKSLIKLNYEKNLKEIDRILWEDYITNKKYINESYKQKLYTSINSVKRIKKHKFLLDSQLLKIIKFVILLSISVVSLIFSIFALQVNRQQFAEEVFKKLFKENIDISVNIMQATTDLVVLFLLLWGICYMYKLYQEKKNERKIAYQDYMYNKIEQYLELMKLTKTQLQKGNSNIQEKGK